jgi:hypothetical protein
MGTFPEVTIATGRTAKPLGRAAVPDSTASAATHVLSGGQSAHSCSASRMQAASRLGSASRLPPLGRTRLDPPPWAIGYLTPGGRWAPVDCRNG